MSENESAVDSALNLSFWSTNIYRTTPTNFGSLDPPNWSTVDRTCVTVIHLCSLTSLRIPLLWRRMDGHVVSWLGLLRHRSPGILHSWRCSKALRWTEWNMSCRYVIVPQHASWRLLKDRAFALLKEMKKLGHVKPDEADGKGFG